MTEMAGQGEAWKDSWNFGTNSEAMNINYWWLRHINNQIDIFIQAWHGQALSMQAYDVMFDSLKMLEALASPKIDKDQVEANLKDLEAMFAQCYQRDAEGKIQRYDPTMLRRIKSLLFSTFTMMLSKLEQNGILTFAKKDPRQAAGQFQNM